MKVTPLGALKSLWLSVLLLISFQLSASHVVGGEVTYQCLGNDYYRVVVTMFRDCSGVILQPTTNVTIKRGDGTAIGTFFPPKGPSSFINVNKVGCGSPTPNICIETADYVLDSVHLPASPFGYSLYNQNCCRNYNVDNILNAWKVGATFHSRIIGTGGGCNSSPTFNQYPPVVLPANVPLAVNISASDPDSDSLSYSLCAPLDDDNTSPPFVTVPFASGFSATNLVTSNPALSMDPVTGIISGTITGAGKYSVGICISEYKNGVLVGTIRRDYQFTVVQPWAVFASVGSSTDASCSGNDGTATIVAGGGAAPYTYSWSSGGNTATVSTLAAGTHTVTVTDNNGCQDVVTVTIGASPAFTTSVSNITNAGCGTSGGGSATITVSGSNGPFTITWPDATVGATNNNLSGGIHAVVVQDGGSCVDTVYVTINAVASTLVTNGTTIDEYCPASYSGSIDVSVSSGTPPYNFAWNDAVSTEDRTALTAGNYWVAVTDSNGCTDTMHFTINSGLGITASFDSIKGVSCHDQTDGYLSAIAANANGSLQYLWSTNAITPSISGLAPGSYWVAITDSVGCADTIYTTVNAPDSLKVTLNQLTHVSCNGLSDGSITVVAQGGTAPYTYAWNTLANTPAISKLTGGNYTVNVTDANGCSVRAVFAVNNPDSLKISLKNLLHESCNGGNGEISVGISGGTKPYTINWNSSQTDSLIQNITAGTYAISVVDSNGCRITSSYTINAPVPLVVTVDSLVSASCGLSNGYVALSVSGGVGSKIINWSNSQSGLSASNLAAGSITAIVTDSIGCSDTVNVIVPNDAGLSITLDSLRAPSCSGLNDGFAKVLPSGGYPPFIINWSNGGGLDSNNTLSSGTAYVVVLDAKGCKDSLSFQVPTTHPLQINLDSLEHISCYGQADGKIKITMTGGTAPYSYNWSNGDTTSTLNKLGSGSYGVTVTDSRACSTTFTYTISEPDSLHLNLKTLKNASCFGGSDGEIAIGISGGTQPYTILWSDNQTDSTAIGLSAGSYTITVTDSSGCVKSATYTLIAPMGIALTLDTAMDASCGQANGSATVSVSGGSGSYSIAWNNSQTGLNATGLLSGAYTAIVTDSLGCTDTLIVSIGNAGSLSAAVDSTQSPSCVGGADGYASASAMGGTAPYSYLWSNADTSSVTQLLVSGSAWVVILDSRGCKDSISFTIPAADTLKIQLDSLENVSCYGQADGKIKITMMGGTAPYSYNWSNGDTTSTLNKLGSGSYGVTVTDSRACSTTFTYTISEPDSLQLNLKTLKNASCFGGSDGEIAIGISGGTQPYTVLWSDNQTDSTALNLGAGNYTVTITDFSGCTLSRSYVITEPVQITIVLDTLTTASCGLSNGSAGVAVTGGTGAYSYQWSNGSTSDTAMLLSSGSHTVVVTDSLGCRDSLTVVVPNAGNLMISLDSVKDVSCFGGSDGHLSVIPSGGVPPYTFNWSNGDTISSLSNVPAGNYTITLIDNSGCSISSSYKVNQNDSLSINLKNLVNAGCDTATGILEIGISGGQKPYSILWSNSQTDSSMYNLTPGNYSVIVTDSNGCIDSATYVVTAPVGITLNLDTILPAQCGAANGIAQLSIQGGVAPFIISWSNLRNSLLVDSLLAGTYNVAVVDSNGCMDSLTLTIPNIGGLSVTMDSLVGPSCGLLNGYGAVSVSGALGHVSYLWSNGDTLSSTASLTSGLGFVLISDALGCSDSLSFTMAASDSVKIALDSLNSLSCNADSSGSIVVSITGGVQPYTYSWTNGDSTSSLSNLPAGTYGLTITDSLGCTATSSYIISEPDSLSVALKSSTNISCVGSNDGQIAIGIKGGTPPYSILWSSSQTDSTASNLFAGSYVVYVTDSLGCQITDTFAITEPDTLTFSVDSILPAVCGQANGYVKLTGVGGTPPYTFEWNTGQLSGEEDSLIAKLYTVKVTDSNGCVYSTHINVPSGATFSAQVDSVVAPSCYGMNDGQAGVSVTGGTAPYSYYWGGGDTSAINLQLLSGPTYVIVSDSRGCSDSLSLIIPVRDSLWINLDSIKDPACNGGNDGFINLTVNGGEAPYQYVWSNGDSVADVLNLISGNYTLTVTDNKGCIITENYILSQPDSLSLSLKNSSDVSCFAGSDGALEVSIQGGVKPYSISWNTTQTDSSIIGLVAGTYAITVTDANGCMALDSFNIQQPMAVTITLDTLTIAGCGQADGTASITVTGGSGVYDVIWSNGERGLLADSLLAGTHTVIAIDTSGCLDSINITIPIAPAVVIALDSVVAPSCYGVNDGQASVSVTGGTAPYSYYWGGGDTSAINLQLLSGTTYVIVSDSRGCSDSLSLIIPVRDSLWINLDSIKDPACNGGNDGFINLTVNGGEAPYQYVWSNGDSVADVLNLISGNYTLTVTDNKGCTITENYILSQPDSLSLSLKNSSDVSCFSGSDGALEVSIQGGVKPYSISWNTTQTDSSIIGLVAGTYAITVTDANGCMAADSFNILQPTSVGVSLDSTTVAGCGKPNGTASITVTGGSGVYDVIWSNGERGLFADSLMAGTHTVTALDTSGCFDSITVTILAAPPVAVALDSVKRPTCADGNDGYASVSVSGGVAPYTYLWDNSGHTATNNFLQSGNASVIITDALGCIDSLNIIVPITDSIRIVVDSIHHVLCFGEPTAFLELSVNGGTKPYNINWGNNVFGKVLQNGVAGVYTVTVTDSNGCINTANFEITEPDTFYVIVDSVKNPTCQGANDGAVYLRASGNHVIANIQANRGKVGSSNVSELGAGKYSFWVENGNGCGTIVNFEIKNPDPIVIEAFTNVSPTCDDDQNGMIELSLSGGNGAPYTQVWDDGSILANRYDLGAGKHVVEVTDVKGCTAEKIFYVAPKKMSIDFSLDAVSCVENADARLIVNVNGASAPYSLWLDDERISADQKVFAGTYELTLIDADSCRTSRIVTVEPNRHNNLFFATAFTPNGDGLNDTYEIVGSPECFPNAKLEIFTRWGGKVFETDEPFEEFWDGTVNGDLAKADIYMYSFSTDQEKKSGYVNILK